MVECANLKKRCIFAKKILICSIELKNKVVKALVLVCTLFLCNRLYSQKFFFETDLGLYHILNYSSASIFQDEKETYSAPFVGLNIGIVNSSGSLFGIGIQSTYIHTSLFNCNEISKQTGFLLSVAYSKSVVQNLSITMSFFIGVASVRNDFEYFDEKFSFKRIGAMSKVKMQLKYRISRKSYFSFGGGLDVLVLSNKKIDLPEGLTPNPINDQTGCFFEIAYGHFF